MAARSFQTGGLAVVTLLVPVVLITPNGWLLVGPVPYKQD